MNPFVDISNLVSPSTDLSLIDQTILSLISPFLGLTPDAFLGNTSDTSTSSPVSSITGSRNSHKACTTPKSAPGPMRNQRKRLDYCKVCQNFISSDGKRSQGPRRHILMHHLCRPIFFCPLCPATSNYDKAHITTHMRSMHKGIGGEIILAEKHTYAEEENRWFERCFGVDSNDRLQSSDQKPSMESNSETDPNTSSADCSPFASGSNLESCASSKTAPGPIRRPRQSLNFCKVCQENIRAKGKWNHGPRRHVLQYHLCRPIFFCPYCPVTNNYDKAIIRRHIQRNHKEIGGEIIVAEKHTFAEEEDRWFKRCFGEEAESRSNTIIKEQDSMLPELTVQQDAADEADENSMPSSSSLAPILLSIDRILGKLA